MVGHNMGMPRKDDAPRNPNLSMATLPIGPRAEFKLPWVNTYTEETADRVCLEVSRGRSLARVAVEETWAPSVMKLYQWLHDHPEFKHAYEMAKAARADAIMFETVELADNSTDHEKTKLQVGVRQHLAARLHSSQYSEKRMLEANLNQRTEIDARIERIDVSHLSLEEIRDAERLLMKTIEGTVEEEE